MANSSNTDSLHVRLRDAYRENIEFARQDLCLELPRRQFDLVVCRYLAFTCFSPDLARCALERIASRLCHGGALVIGVHERLPERAAGFEPWP